MNCNYNNAHLGKCRKTVACSMAQLISLGLCHTLMGANMKGELNRKRPIVMLCNEKLLHGNTKKMSLRIRLKLDTCILIFFLSSHV
jgi:hypothetical protein